MAVSTAVLGGESKNRGTFSGRGSRGVMLAWIAMGAVAVGLIFALELPGLLVAIILAGLLRLLTLRRSGENTLLQTIQNHRRMRFMRRHGFENFTPVDLRPDDLRPTKRDRKAYNEYRDWPDGVDGLYFLEKRPGRPAVAYHSSLNDAEFFAVAFQVDGPIRGLVGDTTLEAAQEGFAELMAGWGSRQKLVSGIQIVTRVLPADTASHEAWLIDQLDPDADDDLVADYSELLSNLAAAAFVQRHYVVIRWAKDARFLALAAARAAGRAGWLSLIQDQTVAARQRLAAAGYREPTALSGPQLAAVIRHLQHPGWPIDRASDVTTDTMYLPSHMERLWVEVTSPVPDPTDPDHLLTPTSWLHRTAQIPANGMEAMPRNGLWLTPLLTGMPEQVVRTLAIHIHFLPAQDAKRSAKLDATSDRADLVGQQRKGKLVDDEAELALESAESRLADIRSGTGHHGAEWAGFVTISVPNREALPTAVSQIEEAADACGINRLDWLDTQHAAAQSLTWPLGKAIASPRRPGASRFVDWIQLRTAGETL